MAARPATASAAQDRDAAALNKQSMLASRVKDCLTSTHNDEDDAVTTRSRLRQKRREEVAKLYNAKSVPVREATDKSRGVLANCYHQECTGEAYHNQPTRPVVDSVVQGRYYQSLSHTADPDVAERARPQIKPVGAFPQDDAHDYWGKALKVGMRPKPVVVAPREYVRNVGVQRAEGDTPVERSPTPDDDGAEGEPEEAEAEEVGAAPEAEAAAQEKLYHKPLVEALPAKVPGGGEYKVTPKTTTSTSMEAGLPGGPVKDVTDPVLRRLSGKVPPLPLRGSHSAAAAAARPGTAGSHSSASVASSRRYKTRPQDTPYLMF